MPKIEFRFDIAAILLASMLTVLGISAASAGGASGGVLGDAKNASRGHQPAGPHSGGAVPSGGRGGIGGEL